MKFRYTVIHLKYHLKQQYLMIFRKTIKKRQHDHTMAKYTGMSAKKKILGRHWRIL